MPTPRLLAVVALFAAVLAGGCARYARRDPPRPASTSLPPRDFASLPPVAAPVPPTPPPLPKPPGETPVAPPKPDALGGIVPNLPAEIPDSPVVQTGAAEPISADADDKKPLRERIEENRKKREERKAPSPGMPSPFAPKATETAPTPKAAAPQSPTNDVVRVRQLLDAATKRWADVPDFEARLQKREVVNGKPSPNDEILYRFRKQPLSVYMKTLSDAGHGREVMYVKGRYDDKLHVITGKGDNPIVGAGYKTELDPDSKLATAKSRHKVYEAGFDRAFNGLTKAVTAAEAGKPVGLTWLGTTKRAEYPYPLDGVELTLQPGQDPLMPKGGKRQFFFDAKPESPSYLLPVLTIATEPDGKEVEYYCFDRFKVPSGLTDADWNPARLGKK